MVRAHILFVFGFAVSAQLADAEPLTASKLAAGESHVCALIDGGGVKCWGDNEYGRLGLEDLDNHGDDPDEMGDELPFVALGVIARDIVAGQGHTCVVHGRGLVKCWGANGIGQLGLGDVEHRGDDAGEMGAHLEDVDLGSDRYVVQIAAGGWHTCAILDNGAVKCWGHNGDGQLGLGNRIHRGRYPFQMGDVLPAVQLGAGRTATQIAAGFSHTCVLLDDGQVKCWGDNYSGQLGLGDLENRGDEPGEMGDDLPAVDLGAGRTATQILAGYAHTCARLDNGTAKCWGDNSQGQLGQGDRVDRGGDPLDMGDNLAAISLGRWNTASRLDVGAFHTCALTGSDLRCFGSNDYGELGLGDTTDRGFTPWQMGTALDAIDLGAGRHAAQVAAGRNFTCARLDDGAVKCWGYNFYGQLGQGDQDWRGDDPDEMGDALPTVELGTR